MAKELSALARNILGARTAEGEWTPMVEIIIIVSEPSFKLDAAGELRSERGRLEDLRFLANVKGLRHLAERLTEYADEAEALEPKGQEGDL
jgi:hypothetical protein